MFKKLNHFCQFLKINYFLHILYSALHDFRYKNNDFCKIYIFHIFIICETKTMHGSRKIYRDTQKNGFATKWHSKNFLGAKA